MASNVVSIPAPGIRSLNGVIGNGMNVDLISSDSSVTITPNILNKTIDLQSAPSPDMVITDVDCDPSVYVGSAVYMSTAGIAYNAKADAFATSNVLGIVESKLSTVKATIRLIGATGALYTGLDPIYEYFLSDTVAGAITTVPATGSGHVLLILGQPLSSTRFVVRKGNRIIRG